MTHSDRTLTLAAGIGALTGLRSMAALTVVSRTLDADGHRAGPAALLSADNATPLLAVAMIGEMMADKLPFVPPRTNVAPLLGRAAFAAFGSAALAQHRGTSILAAAAVGALAATASAALATNVRRLACRRLRVPDFLLGLGEDYIVMTGAQRLGVALIR